MRRLACILVPLILASGCGQATRGEAQAPDSKKVVTLVGPGGSVSIGDSLDVAKKAFPPPKDAQIFNSAMTFTIITKEGWAWATATGDGAFEVATKDGNIIAFALTSKDVSGEPAKSVASLGEPTRKAVGKTTSIFVWESGDNARFWLSMKENPVMPVGSITLVGNKDDLKLLNYRSDDPGTFVKQMDAAADRMHSPEMQKIMQDAKDKAKAGKP